MYGKSVSIELLACLNHCEVTLALQSKTGKNSASKEKGSSWSYGHVSEVCASAVNEKYSSASKAFNRAEHSLQYLLDLLRPSA